MPSKNQAGWAPSSPGAVNNRKNKSVTTPQAMHAPTNSGVDKELADEEVDDLLKGSLLKELNGTIADKKFAIAP